MDLDRQLADLQGLGYVVVGGPGRYRLGYDLEVPACAVRVLAPDWEALAGSDAD